MRIPRVYVPKALASGSTISVTGQQARHITQVLRLRNGDHARPGSRGLDARDVRL